MIAPAPARQIIKQLQDAGFTGRDGKGSHTFWSCAHGIRRVSVPTGNRTISAGVRRKVNAAIQLCQNECEDT